MSLVRVNMFRARKIYIFSSMRPTKEIYFAYFAAFCRPRTTLRYEKSVKRERDVGSSTFKRSNCKKTVRATRRNCSMSPWWFECDFFWIFMHKFMHKYPKGSFLAIFGGIWGTAHRSRSSVGHINYIKRDVNKYKRVPQKIFSGALGTTHRSRSFVGHINYVKRDVNKYKRVPQKIFRGTWGTRHRSRTSVGPVQGSFVGRFVIFSRLFWHNWCLVLHYNASRICFWSVRWALSSVCR